jgi:hypothetical protein
MGNHAPAEQAVTRDTLERRMVAAANLRAFEAWMVNIAQEAKVPLRWFTSATVALSEPGHEPVVVIVVGLRRSAWLALGILHFVAWWRVRRQVGDKRNGYKVIVWIN